MGAFLLSLAQRDLAAAESALQALRLNTVLGIPEAEMNAAALLAMAVGKFWQSVDEGAKALSPGDKLTIGGVAEIREKNIA